jgi:sporulation protein YlmC with PRC-barrel domain
MRLSELLGCRVVDTDGESIGGVADVVLVQDGPLVGGHIAALRVAGLIVVRRRHMRLLGYEFDLRPAAFRWLVRRLAGSVHHVEWSQVASVDGRAVTLRVRERDLPAHRRQMRPIAS